MLPKRVVRGRKNPLHVGFAERLRRTRQASSLSFTALAQKAGISNATTTSTLEHGKNIPRVDTVEKLARALRVSPAWLAFGVVPIGEASSAPGYIGLGPRLREVRKQQDFSLRAMERCAGLSSSLVRKTELGLSVPTLGTVEKLAKALGVSPAWLAYGLGPMEVASGKRTQSVSVQP